MAGVLLQPFGILVNRAAVRQRAAGVQIGQQNQFARIKNLSRLRHEMNAAEDNLISVGGRRRLGQRQAVADMVGEVLNIGVLVIVRQNDGVPLGFQASNLGFEIKFRINAAHTQGEVSFLPKALRWRVRIGAGGVSRVP